MRKQIIIHIGSVKTGTSYLQSLFSANREALKAGGINYPAYRERGSGRYANGNILRDRRAASRLRGLVEATDCRTIILSEEGLFSDIDHVIPEYFWDHDVKIIAYIREPLEVISSWAAEFSKPYNAMHGNIIDIEKNISILCDRYDKDICGLLNSIDVIGEDKFIIRPYSRSNFKKSRLDSDFFYAIGDSDAINLLEKEISHSINPTPSRKYCDISVMLYDILKKSDRLYDYNEFIVNAIHEDCKSGDNRSVSETIHSKFGYISEKLSWINMEIGKRISWKREECQNGKSIHFGPFLPYKRLNKFEVEYHLLRRLTALGLSRISSGISPYSSTLSDKDISIEIERSLNSLERLHGDILQQRSELLKMRRLVDISEE